MASGLRLWESAGYSNQVCLNDPACDEILTMDLNEIAEFMHSAARSVGAEVTSPWFYLQLGLILIGAGIALGVGAAIRSRIDITSFAMGWPAPLRLFMRVLVGSASTAVLALLMTLARLLLVALWVASIASNFVESRITRSADLTPSIQVLMIKVIRLALMVFAVAVVLSAAGINLSAMAIFSGAAGVGIGFGLQKIVADFVSGIILLADKSVKPGDLITIGDTTGRINEMKTCYISVAAGDGREFLIPNEDLVTQKVVNWTYTDKNTLVKVNFGTNYDADPRLVCKLAAEIATTAPRAIKGKPPNCILTEFTEAGMKFSLTFWIADPDGMDNVKSDVMLALWDAFKREGIRVPYPVREIRVRGGALPVETVVEVPNG